MGQRLINALTHVTPVVIDFEYTTPTGAPFEPIEVAVQTLHVRNRRLERAARWEALMRPPTHAELTPFDIGQTGITPDMLADQPYPVRSWPSWTATSPPGPTCSSPTTPQPKPG
ncbi:MAG TPA: exonuclease domain-containing protein [Pseudonocardiaceae bacterium]